MKLLWLDPQAISDEQWRGLIAGGRPSGWTETEIAQALLSGRLLAFATDGGVLAVEKQGSRLFVRMLAIDKFGWRLRAFRDLMDRLAADMACDTVETDCFDPRLARAMMRIRAKPVAWTMRWQVEGTADGRQDQAD